MPELDPYRLPRTAVPHRYDLRLHPDLAAASFAGSADITVEIVPAGDMLDELVLNAADLDVTAATVDGITASWRLDSETQRLFVTPSEPLAAGTIMLHLAFTGTLNDKLRGWYRSTYTDADGTEQVIATSQMQATDCRRAFPCWDEPDFKAVFSVTLVVDDQLLAVSNGAEVERTPAGNSTVAVRFGDTMPMSTYLVAFVVGPLEATEPVDVDGVPLRIVHVPGKGHLTGMGLDVGRFCLRWYQDYYGIPYPSDKVDLLALPDFAAGAMENLGCITFRENLLLVDSATSTQGEQQLVADVVAHELAHMWFGDLVTMRWWNGIWLNEAFATFMEVAACEAYRPDWRRWTSFSLERSVAFETDSLASTRSVEFAVRSAQDSEGMFDVLTYQKGGALLRMLEQYLGEDRFRAGVSHYLKVHTYGNTETEDLWDAIEETSGEPVRRIMDSWIWQPGYPLISAALDGETLVLRQHRFAFGELEGDAAATRWLVPIHVRNGGTEVVVLLEDEKTRWLLAEPDAAVVVNAGGHGFMRVAYDDALRGRLDRDAVAGLSTVERYTLVDDAWSATVAGRLGAPELLELLRGFTGERELEVWQVIAVALRGLGRLVDGEALAALRERVRALVAPALHELGWEPSAGEADLRGKLRGLLVAASGVLGGDDATLARCRSLLAEHAADPASVHPELVASATSVVAARGDAQDYDHFLAAFRDAAATPQEQLRNLYALAEFDDAELIARTCTLAFEGDVKTQNAPFLLNRCIANRNHGEQAWADVRRNWALANERFPDNTIVRMVDPVKMLNTETAMADVRAFFGEHPIPQATKTLEQILERQGVNVALRARESSRLTAALT